MISQVYISVFFKKFTNIHRWFHFGYILLLGVSERLNLAGGRVAGKKLVDAEKIRNGSEGWFTGARYWLIDRGRSRGFCRWEEDDGRGRGGWAPEGGVARWSLRLFNLCLKVSPWNKTSQPFRYGLPISVFRGVLPLNGFPVQTPVDHLRKTQEASCCCENTVT